MQSPTDRILSELVKRITKLEHAARRQGSRVDALRPVCTIYNTSPTTGIVSGTTTLITLDQIETESHPGMADTANSRIVVPAARMYVAIGSLEWSASAGGGHRDARIYLNSAATLVGIDRDSGVGNETDQRTAIMRPRALAEGDTIDLRGHQNSGGPLQVNAAAEYSPYLSLFDFGPIP